MPTNLTKHQIELMRHRKSLAINSLRIFKEVKRVKSTNYFFDFTNPLQRQTLLNNRLKEDYNTMSGPLTSTLIDGVGNCDEKARICWAGIKYKPDTLPHHHCTLCKGFGYDHVFVVITDHEIPKGIITELSALGATALVVDGWTEDWYFPNVSMWELSGNLGFLNLPNFRQLPVRYNTYLAKIYNYESDGVIYDT